MILVLLGTIKLEFRRPLVEIDDLCHKKIIKEKIIVQSGYTQYNSEYMALIPFLDPNKLSELIEKASLIITHAGTGSVVGSLKKRKKIIAIARYQELGEHVDNHQLDLLDEFSKKGYLIPWFKNEKLIDIYSKIDGFTPLPYISQKDNILAYLTNYINNI